MALIIFGSTRGEEPTSNRVTVSESIQFGSLAELRSASDASLMVRVEDIVREFEDYGGNPPTNPDGDDAFHLDRLIYRAEPLDRNLSMGPVFLVTDNVSGFVDEITPRFGKGEVVVVFVDEAVGRGWSPEFLENTADLEGTVYAVVGGNQGVFDVRGDVGVSRAEPGLGEIGVDELLESFG
jgi:hypothetical protein